MKKATVKTKTKAKAVKSLANAVIKVRLPKPLVGYISEVAELAGLDAGQIINVIIAIQILREEKTRKEAAGKQ